MMLFNNSSLILFSLLLQSIIGHVAVVHARVGVDDNTKGEEEEEEVVATTTTIENEKNKQAAEPFYIRDDTSVLDYLDPTILNDPNIISDIQDNFRKGNLIVIKDAFLPEFADHVYADMAHNESIVWQPFVSIKPNGHNFYKHKMKQRTDIMEQVREVFKHEKSREFFTMLSGRNCMNEKQFSAL